MTKQGWLEILSLAGAAFASAYAELHDWRKALAAAVAIALVKRADPKAAQAPELRLRAWLRSLRRQRPADG